MADKKLKSLGPRKFSPDEERLKELLSPKPTIENIPHPSIFQPVIYGPLGSEEWKQVEKIRSIAPEAFSGVKNVTTAPTSSVIESLLRQAAESGESGSVARRLLNAPHRSNLAGQADLEKKEVYLNPSIFSNYGGWDKPIWKYGTLPHELFHLRNIGKYRPSEEEELADKISSFSTNVLKGK